MDNQPTPNTLTPEPTPANAVPPLGPNPVPPKQPSPPKSKKGLIIVIVIVLLLAGAAVYYFTQKKETKTSSGGGPETSERAPTITNTTVEITATGLNPSTVKIQAGSQVTWKNTDKATHRITADPYPTKSSLPDLDSKDPLATNDTFGFIFEKSGTYTYNDYLNPTNKAYHGTVIVE